MRTASQPSAAAYSARWCRCTTHGAEEGQLWKRRSRAQFGSGTCSSRGAEHLEAPERRLQECPDQVQDHLGVTDGRLLLIR